MRKPTLWLIAIAVIAVAAVAFIRISDDEPGIAAPPTTSGTDTSTSSTSSTSTTMTVSSTAPPVTLPPGVGACDVYSSIIDVGVVQSEGLIEASGMAVSRVDETVLWSHNDSGDDARLYAFDTTGTSLGVFDVPGALAFDWEDMAAGPGPDGTGSYLYVGDIGDNFYIRGGRIAVYRVPDADPRTMGSEFDEVVALTYEYPDDIYNAEAFFIDPVEPALYIVTKDKRKTLVFKGPITMTDGTVELELVAMLRLDSEVSGADISWDGGVIALRGYRSVWMWTRTEGSTIQDALAG
ncbi:MAG: hypothetical protein M3094_07280, partial [Actinomycetia bacterium]|nr:hypothetical protein [Actinomycetes bacterium]